MLSDITKIHLTGSMIAAPTKSAKQSRDYKLYRPGALFWVQSVRQQMALIHQGL